MEEQRRREEHEIEIARQQRVPVHIPATITESNPEAQMEISLRNEPNTEDKVFWEKFWSIFKGARAERRAIITDWNIDSNQLVIILLSVTFYSITYILFKQPPIIDPFYRC